MIHALLKEPLQFSAGMYYLTANEPEGQYFEYTWEDNEKSSTRSAQGHNVVRNDGFTRVSTDYDLGFVAGAFVALDDGNLYIIEQITKAAVVIYVTCEPCWEAYRRWSSIIIDDFYKSMQAVRSYFGIKWEDISKTQDVTWGEVEFRYISKAPITVIRQDIPPCNYYGDTVNERVTDVRVHFSMTVPNFPDDQKNAANCHVIEEEVTTTSTRKVKRLRCE